MEGGKQQMRFFVCTTFLLALLTLPGPRLRAQAACAGDCDGDGTVRPEDLRRVTYAVFDPEIAASCPAADADDNGSVTSADVVAVVLSLLDPECAGNDATRTPSPPRSTPTATATASPLRTPSSSWVNLTPLGEGPRQEVGVAGFGNKIYVIGGFDGEGRVEAYDVFTNTWATVASLPAARNHVGAAEAGGHVYAVGGFADTGFVPVSSVFRYDPTEDRWESVAPLPRVRGALAAAALRGRVHAIGGTGSSGASVTRHDVYDPATDSWTEMAPLPTARNHLAAVTIGDFVYAVGGRGGANTGELDRYNPDADQWDVLAPMPTARSGIAAAAIDGKLVVLGGEVNPASPQGVFAEVEVYDPDTDAWASLEPMPVPRHGVGAVEASSLIYVPGGATRAGFEATDHVDALQIAF
jgi:N-acetylneuraminic acid mutarotase